MVPQPLIAIRYPTQLEKIQRCPAIRPSISTLTPERYLLVKDEITATVLDFSKWLPFPSDSKPEATQRCLVQWPRGTPIGPQPRRQIRGSSRERLPRAQFEMRQKVSHAEQDNTNMGYWIWL